MASSPRSISLVLGGGGARGYAHIGVVRALEEQGLAIRAIAGCSMGALVGGIYAAGKLAEFEAWARKIDRRRILSLADLAFGGGGLLKGERLIGTLREMVGNQLIQDLPIPFTAVATDLAREREVWIDRGPLFDAVRASISLPVFFTPVDYLGTRLVDGGMLDPVPTSVTFRDRTDLRVAVSLSGPARREPPAPGAAQEPEKPWELSYVASQSLDVMQAVITRQRLAANPPDVLIEIPRDACGLLEFDQAERMIALGYEQARARLAGLGG